MDPIHPILPQKPNIPPVAEAPRVGRIDRRDPREHPGERRRKGDDAQDPGRASAGAADVADADETGPHIDITA
jgi:hypothetical protein